MKPKGPVGIHEGWDGAERQGPHSRWREQHRLERGQQVEETQTLPGTWRKCRTMTWTRWHKASWAIRSH